MKNEEATIANIRAQLISHGWTRIEEFIDTEKQYKSEDNCHLELYHEDGTRKAWGMFPRLYCWTEAYEEITGRPWMESVVRRDAPSP